MRVHAPILPIVALCSLAGCASAARTPDVGALQRSSFEWSQAEREWGFAHWDAVYPGRRGARAARVRPWRTGPGIGGLADGSAGGAALERFAREQYVAALLIVHRGQLRLERYGLALDARGRWTSQSVATSVTSTLVGVAVREGAIGSLDESVAKYVADLRGSAYDGVTIRQLLTMTTGVGWNEDYADPESDIARFYAAPVSPGMTATVSYMRTLARVAPAGARWHYSTGETHLLGAVVEAATGMPLAEYLASRLWQPLGMEQPAVWTLDRTGHELAGCCLQLAPRDLARFGAFLLAGGRVADRALLPDGWIEAATRTQTGTPYGRAYGYQWWIGPDGTFDAIGIHGQLLHVDPARELVVVIASAWPEPVSRERSAARDAFLHLVAESVDAERARDALTRASVPTSPSR